VCKKIFNDKKSKFINDSISHLFITIDKLLKMILFIYFLAKESHLEIVHDQKRDFVCHQCGKAFSTERYLEVHLQRHDVTEREFKCDSPGCTLAFKLVHDLRAHKRHVHMRQSTKICQQCGAKLNNKTALERHILRFHTENAPKKFKCQICPKEFVTETNFAAHMKLISHGGPGLKKRKWIPKHVRLQMKIDKGLVVHTISQESGTESSKGLDSTAYDFQMKDNPMIDQESSLFIH